MGSAAETICVPAVAEHCDGPHAISDVVPCGKQLPGAGLTGGSAASPISAPEPSTDAVRERVPRAGAPIHGTVDRYGGGSGCKPDVFRPGEFDSHPSHHALADLPDGSMASGGSGQTGAPILPGVRSSLPESSSERAPGDFVFYDELADAPTAEEMEEIARRGSPLMGRVTVLSSDGWPGARGRQRSCRRCVEWDPGCYDCFLESAL